MSSGLIQIMKEASLSAMANEQLCDLRYGKVISTSPLKVQVTQQFILPESLLVVPQSLTDYEIDVSVDWTTGSRSGGSGEASFASHTHAVSGNKKLKIHNALKIGDKVALIRKQGGQSYLILDRIN